LPAPEKPESTVTGSGGWFIGMARMAR